MRPRSIIAMLPLLLTALISFPGAAPSFSQQTGPAGAVVCGTIDMSLVDARLDWVDLLRIDVEPAEVVTLKARDSIFWGSGIKPGRYLYLRFGGKEKSGTADLVYLFPPEGVSWAEFDPLQPDLTAADIGQRDVVVTEAGLYWLGARRVSPEGPTRYHTVTVGSPGEKEALERLLTIIEDTATRTIIQNRLKEIGKN